MIGQVNALKTSPIPRGHSLACILAASKNLSVASSHVNFVYSSSDRGFGSWVCNKHPGLRCDCNNKWCVTATWHCFYTARTHSEQVSIDMQWQKTAIHVHSIHYYDKIWRCSNCSNSRAQSLLPRAEIFTYLIFDFLVDKTPWII